MVLLEDEKNVMRWLSQYGPLENRQLIKLLKCSDRVAFRIMKNLRKLLMKSVTHSQHTHQIQFLSVLQRKVLN